jgi:hypothetical protein
MRSIFPLSHCSAVGSSLAGIAFFFWVFPFCFESSLDGNACLWRSRLGPLA